MAQVPIHPAIVHFPIALAVVGALAEVVHLVLRKPWLRWMGPILLTVALMGAVGAYFTGNAAEDAVEDQGVPEKAIGGHEQSGTIAMASIALAALLSWATRPKDRGLPVAAAVAVIAAGITIYTGFLGGELVYVHGAGQVAPAGQTGAGRGQGAEGARESGGEHEGREHSGGDRD